MTRKITQIVDEQVQRWRSESSERTERKPESFVPANVVTISRASGTFGGEVARQVGRILDLPVYDQEIVEHIAAKKNLRLETVNTLDEYAQSRLDDYVTALFREKNFDQSDYLRALTETIMGLWGHGPCVLVGRGAHQIVYRKNGLSVRLVAPLSYRVRFKMYADEMDEMEATRTINRKDAERDAFIRRFFNKGIDDPTDYDLVLNVTGLKGDDCAAIIADAFEKKFATS